MSEASHHQVNQPGDHDNIFFYPKEFYVFDNFSSFQVEWHGFLWPTSEHAFQAAGFIDTAPDIYSEIQSARSAHDAQKVAYQNRDKLPSDWDNIKVNLMKDILRHKIDQHPYVLKKLLQSGTREIIEDSWRDSEWGWGLHQDGQNKLGHIWMDLRTEYQKK
ncbi:MAG: NADAR family protein [Microgenomates group bacterium]